MAIIHQFLVVNNTLPFWRHSVIIKLNGIREL